MTSIQTFCLFHKTLNEQMYSDGARDNNSFCFVRVGNHPYTVNSDSIRSAILDANLMKNFRAYGPRWAEFEFLLNLVSHPETFDEIVTGNWICVTQYDHSLSLASCGMNLYDFFMWKYQDGSTVRPNTDYFALRTFSIREYELPVNRTCMDYSNPQKLQGNPSCYRSMAEHFNEYYGTRKTEYDVFIHDENKLALCSSFIVSRSAFKDMIGYLRWVADNKNLECFDPQKTCRQQGGLMERYLASWFVFRSMRMFDASVQVVSV